MGSVGFWSLPCSEGLFLQSQHFSSLLFQLDTEDLPGGGGGGGGKGGGSNRTNTEKGGGRGARDSFPNPLLPEWGGVGGVRFLGFSLQ